MAVATLPPPVDIDNETKKAIIDGLKRVMTVLMDLGALPQGMAYQHLIAHPEILMGFIGAFQANRAKLDDIVKAREGKAPVRDDDQTLICGVSLNQVQQLLVRTCAKKVFESDKTQETVTETVTKTSFLFFKRTENVEVTRTANDPVEERKIREITRCVAFGWQLPLLNSYRDRLSFPQIIEIGEDLVALQSDADIAAVASFDAQVLKKVKAATGTDFPEILAHRPQAIAGIATWNRDMYEFYRKILGDKAWTFFARDKSFFNVVASLDKSTAKVFGDVLCYVHGANLEEIQRLNIDKCEVLVLSLKGAFGDKLPTLMAQPTFGAEILRKVIDNLLHMSQEKDKLITAFTLTCKSLVPGAMEWLSKQPPR
jgi:hypothetical protein